MLSIGAVLALAALACVIAAMVFDLVRFEIPDAISIAVLTLAIGYGLATPGFAWLSHIAAVAVVFAGGLFIFSRGWMGGGDIKLLTSIAGWAGLAGVAQQLTATAIAGGGLAIAVLLLRNGLALAGVDTRRMPRFFHRDAPMPYAVAIAVGTVWWGLAAWPIA